MEQARALYERDGAIFVPSGLTRGPWQRDAQHGGAPAALLATLAQSFDNGSEMSLARITVELLRPVPISPLTVDVVLERPGRKVQLIGLSLHSGDTEVARARALRIRAKAIRLPAGLSSDAKPDGPEKGAASLPQWQRPPELLSFVGEAVEHRFVDGGFDRPGPSTDWIRLRVPVVGGEEIVPVARVLAAADFGNGVSWELDRRDGYVFINPDLTVHLMRAPVGEWVCLQARSRFDANGIGFAESLLSDETGPIGRSIQSLLLDQ